MDSIRVRIGALSADNSYPLELLNFHNGQPLTGPASLSKAEVDASPWTPAAIRKEFAQNSGGSDNFRQIGDQLAEWILRGPVGTEWGKQRGGAVRTMLEIEAPDLIDLPWELLGGELAPLFRDAVKPLMRYHRGPAVADQTAPWPVRLLIVAGTLEKKIDAATEIDRMEEDLLPYSHSIDLEVLREPTQAEFTATIQSFQPHILHFTGHSSTPGGGAVPVLHFQKSLHQWNWSSADVLVNLGQWQWHPRLVFLNACRTGNTAAARGIVDAFNRAGVPATIANQGDIPGDLAGKLAVKVYKELWEGKPLDVAMVSGREAIIQGTASDRRDWAFPVLSLSALPEDVLPQINICPPGRYTHIEKCNAFAEANMIAGRRQERRMVRTRFVPIRPAHATEFLVLITGETKLGKSHIMKWLGEGFALGGADVHYVTIGDGAKKTSLDVLWKILDAIPERSAEPIPRDVLYRFNWAVHRILTSDVRSAWDGKPFEKRTEFEPGKLENDETIGLIFEAFYAALREASAKRQLVIVLDEFRYNNELVISPELMNDELWPRLFDLVGSGKFPNIRMALVMRPDDASACRMDKLILPQKWITLKPFPKNDFRKMARELFWFCDESGLSDLIAAIEKGLADPWHPGALDRLRRAANEVYTAKEHMARVKRMQ